LIFVLLKSKLIFQQHQQPVSCAGLCQSRRVCSACIAAALHFACAPVFLYPFADLCFGEAYLARDLVVRQYTADAPIA
jgi:hypothetical protein